MAEQTTNPANLSQEEVKGILDKLRSGESVSGWTYKPPEVREGENGVYETPESFFYDYSPKERQGFTADGLASTNVFEPGAGYRRVKKYIEPLVLSSLSFIPGLGQGIGAALGASGTAASMLGSAVLGGTRAAFSGGDFLKGALGGGLGAGVGALVQPIAGNIGSTIGQQTGSETVGNMVSGGIRGATQSGVGALVSGQDVGDALIQGGLGGGISSGISSGVNAAFGDTTVPADAQKFIGSFMSSQLTPRVLDELGLGRSSGSSSSSSSRPSGSFRSSGGISPNDLTLLALMSQLQGQRPQQTQQVPGYSNAARSPFGSILE